MFKCTWLFLFVICLQVSAESQTIFEKFSWLSSLVDEDNCNSGTSITEYDLGEYSFVYLIQDTEESLYFENGLLYCRSFIGFDCLSFYGLNNENRGLEWICNSNSEMDDTPETDLFEKYDWLQEIIGGVDCLEGSVEEYNNGGYSFLVIDDGSTRRMFYQDGTLYCTFSSSNDCFELYRCGPCTFIRTGVP